MCLNVFHIKRREISGKILQLEWDELSFFLSNLFLLIPLAVAVVIASEESVPRRTGLILSWNTEQ